MLVFSAKAVPEKKLVQRMDAASTKFFMILELSLYHNIFFVGIQLWVVKVSFTLFFQVRMHALCLMKNSFAYKTKF